MQQHRLRTSSCTNGTMYHSSAVSTALVLLKFACQLLEQSRQVCGTEVDPADACGRAVADAHSALERHALAPANSPGPACVTADQGPERGMEASGGAQSGSHDDGAETAFVPRYPRPVQTFDEAVTDRDHKVLVVMALALPGRAAIDLVDASRLKVWLTVPGPGEAPADSTSRAASLMTLWQHLAHRCSAAQTLAACARRVLERAKCLRPGAAAGSVEVYHAADDRCPAGGPGKWKAVDLASAADQQHRHSLLQ